MSTDVFITVGGLAHVGESICLSGSRSRFKVCADKYRKCKENALLQKDEEVARQRKSYQSAETLLALLLS